MPAPDVSAFAAEARLNAVIDRFLEDLSLVRQEERGAVSELLTGWLETISAGPPTTDLWSDMREAAAFWADIATPAELEAYVAAGLRRIERRQFAQAARKRLFVNLWEVMPEADRRAFVRRVDPQGKFHKGGA